MICSLYESLTPVERVEVVGKVVHCLQSDNNCFLQLQAIVALAERKGLFENVVINPPENKIEDIP